MVASIKNQRYMFMIIQILNLRKPELVGKIKAHLTQS